MPFPTSMRPMFFWLLLFIASVFIPLSANAEEAPKFTLPGIKSKVSLAAYKGRVVYVDFWASWCIPCRKSFPWMSEMQKKYGKKLKVIAINLDEDRKDAYEFLKQNTPGFTVAFDPAGKVAEAYKVKGMPSSYLVDQRGRLAGTHIGFRGSEKEKMESEIRKLIAKQK